jgi:hypothetical protein
LLEDSRIEKQGYDIILILQVSNSLGRQLSYLSELDLKLLMSILFINFGVRVVQPEKSLKVSVSQYQHSISPKLGFLCKYDLRTNEEEIPTSRLEANLRYISNNLINKTDERTKFKA